MGEPNNPASYIPVGVQTFAAPVSYALHPVLAPPRFERLQGRPLRVNCRDYTVQLLSDPQIVEDLPFSSPNLPGPGTFKREQPFKFPISEARVKTSEKFYYETLIKEKMKEEEAVKVANETANSFSGMAFWPRLVLDTAGEIVVESRGPLGEHQKSHWQTLLSLMSPTPVPVTPGDVLEVTEEALIDRDVLKPVKYKLETEIVKGA